MLELQPLLELQRLLGYINWDRPLRNAHLSSIEPIDSMNMCAP